MDPLRIGIIGCGNISGIYFKNLGLFAETEVVACADLDLGRAQAAAEEHGIANPLSPDELLAHPDVELVLNLTVPKAHASVARNAIRAGKHVYNEKPLTDNFEEAKLLIQEAKAANLVIGCAPDTFLGAGIQTCRELIEQGAIGTPVAARGSMLSRGPENWHPAPEFFYKRGGGPMLDMGPYYLTAMVALLGPIRRVTGSTRVSFPQRPIAKTNEKFYGKPADEVAEAFQISVETPTHLAGVFDMANGAVAELTTSFDVYGDGPKHPITIFGSEGTLGVPDPNTFGGPVRLFSPKSWEWEEVPIEKAHAENSRGIGIVDIARAIRTGSSVKASGELALHVLEVMLSFEKSSDEGQHIVPETKVNQPEAFAG